MNTYKTVFWVVIGLIYIAMFWVLPVFIVGNEAYILNVLILHGMTLLVLAPMFLLAFLAVKAGY
jgi:hypothetical protein